MAVLKASEKLKLLAMGKATLKEINELEAQALQEGEEDASQELQSAIKEETTETAAKETDSSEQPKETDASIQNALDEKDAKIAELEEKLKEAQANNVHNDIGGNEPSFDEQLDEMFKGYRF